MAIEFFPHPPNSSRKKSSTLKGQSGFDITSQKSVDIAIFKRTLTRLAYELQAAQLWWSV